MFLISIVMLSWIITWRPRLCLRRNWMEKKLLWKINNFPSSSNIFLENIEMVVDDWYKCNWTFCRIDRLDLGLKSKIESRRHDWAKTCTKECPHFGCWKLSHKWCHFQSSQHLWEEKIWQYDSHFSIRHNRIDLGSTLIEDVDLMKVFKYCRNHFPFCHKMLTDWYILHLWKVQFT